MKFLIAFLLLIVFIGLYIVAYLLNLKVNKPTNCKNLECNVCKLSCNKRGEDNE